MDKAGWEDNRRFDGGLFSGTGTNGNNIAETEVLQKMEDLTETDNFPETGSLRKTDVFRGMNSTTG